MNRPRSTFHELLPLQIGEQECLEISRLESPYLCLERSEGLELL